MEQLWQIVAPYITTVLGVTGGSGIVYILIRLLLGKILNKNEQSLSQMFDTNALSQKIADKFAGKTLNIDVTAITENALKGLKNTVDKKMEQFAEVVDGQKHILALIAGALVHLKALKPAEIEELTAAIKAIERGYKPPEPAPAPLTVTLAPVPVDEDGEALPAAVNFGNLGG